MTIKMYSLISRLGVASLLSIMLPACDDTSNVEANLAPPTVTVSQPIKRSIVEWDEYTGRFAAVDSVEVRARVSGYLDSIHFNDGQMVETGDLLFVIDPRLFEIAREQVDAELVQAQARLELAARDLERAEPLIKRGTISQEFFDERAQENREAAAAVEAAEANVRRAMLNLEFTRVRAPVSGRVSRKFVTTGNLVSGGADASTILTTIVTLDPIHFYFDADEKAYLKYVRLALSGERPSVRTTQTPVFLRLSDEREYLHGGYMDFIDNQINFSSGTVRSRAIFDNSDQLFIPGLFARIRLPGSGEYEALLLPDAVIGTDQSRRFVYVIDDQDVVAYRQVELGPLVDGLRVIRNGLHARDRVVTKGIQRIRAGVKVTAEREVLDEVVHTASTR